MEIHLYGCNLGHYKLIIFKMIASVLPISILLHNFATAKEFRFLWSHIRVYKLLTSR